MSAMLFFTGKLLLMHIFLSCDICNVYHAWCSMFVCRTVLCCSDRTNHSAVYATDTFPVFSRQRGLLSLGKFNGRFMKMWQFPTSFPVFAPAKLNQWHAPRSSCLCDSGSNMLFIGTYIGSRIWSDECSSGYTRSWLIAHSTKRLVTVLNL